MRAIAFIDNWVLERHRWIIGLRISTEKDACCYKTAAEGSFRLLIEIWFCRKEVAKPVQSAKTFVALTNG